MIKVQNLKKRFKFYKKPSDRLKELLFRRTYHTVYEALKGVSFEVKSGEVLGIVGPNGAGKSTLLKILTGVLLPDEGKVIVSGRITGLLELGTGFNYEMSGLENIYMNGLLLGMTREELDAKKEAIISFSELGDFIYEPLKTYSSGMVMRLAFSIAIHADPTCFVVDEALSVGDAHFQQKCIKKIKEFREKGGSIVFVSHDLNAVKILCDEAILLHQGEVLEKGSSEKVINAYNRLLAFLAEKENKIFTLSSNKSSSNPAYGTLEATIKEVSFQGEDSGSSVVSSGEWAFIKIIFKAFKDIPSLTVGILIRDRFGQDVFGVNTSLLNKPISISAGSTYEVLFKVKINLAPGKYTVTAALHHGERHTEKCYHWIDSATSFEVAGFKCNAFSGLVSLPVEVSFQPCS